MLKIVQVLLDAVKEIQLAIENFKPWGVGFKEKMKNYEFGGPFPAQKNLFKDKKKVEISSQLLRKIFI